ncbi:MAG TPA: tRNA lysidine(34) synthetase TilS, partial [Rhodobacteraceae bacterium]|nr:tRNA lysidine(34) synthetase TilS [Paracoccaceae bacterium]
MSVFSDFMDGLPDGPIGLAVSGGSDSLALLVLTVDWAKKCGRSVFVVTLDHGLREEAANEAEGVAKICAGLGVSHDTLRWDGHHKGNTQDAARRVRQRLIGDWAKTHDLVAVATGHTRDDQAETFLLRLKRGSGVDGLSGMARCIEKDGVLWVRPLLHKRRDALRATLKDRGVAWFDDPSNGDNRYDRVKVRKALKIIQ